MYRIILVDLETLYSRSERRPVCNERYVGEFALSKEVTGSLKRLARKHHEPPHELISEALSCYFGDGTDNWICRDCERFPYLRCTWDQERDNAENDWYTAKEPGDPVESAREEPGTIQDGKTTLPLLD